ncbi:reverse transcriptase domain-containing protein [Tanacetum coccineum]
MLKEVQSLNGKLASLNRFLSKAAEKSLSFFKTLKRCIKKSDFVWTEEANKALQEMKKQMAELPTLTAQIEGETLIMYISAAEKAPRTSVKGQILVDFIAELPAKESDSDEKVVTNGVPAKEVWRLFTDKSSNEGGPRAGLILTNPVEVKFTYALHFKFKASNNEAEYEALLAGLRIAEKIGVKHIKAFVDSKLVENHINDLYHGKLAL